ncbi:U-box domain-containing protein kinase family protein isoform X2 [Tasmannia lanceolata]|uniref:U-box domain-containing protein kinase family protein isoform X2 n=1 Tax=Tasmannia lanceolata TaxID=3420 RepID=UPI004063E1BF
MKRSNSNNSMRTVAVAVSSGYSRSSRRAVRWAVENLMPQAHRFLLLHVAPLLKSIPTPCDQVRIQQVRGDVVAMYMQDMKLKSEEIFLPFKRLCRTLEMETLVLDDDSPATALLKYISESGTESLVMGSSSLNCILRKLRCADVPSTVLKQGSNTCNIYVVSRHKLKMKLVDPYNLEGPHTASQIHHPRKRHQSIKLKVFAKTKGGHSIDKLTSGLGSFVGTKGQNLEVSNKEDFNGTSSRASNDGDSFTNVGAKSQVSFLLPSSEREHREGNLDNLENRTLEVQTCKEHDIVAAFKDTPLSLLQFTEESDVQAEIERLRQELQNTLTVYNEACEDLIYAKRKAQFLFVECSEEARKVRDALEREEISKRVAAEENTKHLEAIKEAEVARQLFAKEAHERQRAQMNALKESSEKKKVADALFSSDKRCRWYSKDEIEVATDGFSEAKRIGEGSYGAVYKCNLDHTPVAVKVLRQDASDKKEEFLREVEILSQLHHPHIVLLLGACPENGCLVYEYMENGSLEDRLFFPAATTPLPWFIRFQIVYEMACGLAFLHVSKPEPIVHRDLKPGNILLDKNFVSKIGDVGLAKIISDVVPDGVTEYRDTILAGTLYYMDPEYQRTGTVRPKSDLYAFGIITLQLLTAKHPLGLLVTVESAINNGSFVDILDKSISDWPLSESEKLAQIALKCSRLRCRDRPDLESEVLPELKELLDVVDAHIILQRCNIPPLSHYFCPILQDVMDDPYIAADGFTYEYRAIKAWLEKYSISPVTKLRLAHNQLTPNHTMHSAIQEWKSLTTLSSS